MGYIEGDTGGLDNGSYGERRVWVKEVLKHKLAKRSAPSCASLPLKLTSSNRELKRPTDASVEERPYMNRIPKTNHWNTGLLCPTIPKGPST